MSIIIPKRRFLYNKQTQYNKNNPDVNRFADEIKESIYPIIKKYYDKGYSDPELMYFLEDIIRWELLEYNMKREYEEINESEREE